MEKPRIAAKQPAVISLDPGTYHWCLCGRRRVSVEKQSRCCPRADQAVTFVI